MSNYFKNLQDALFALNYCPLMHNFVSFKTREIWV